MLEPKERAPFNDGPSRYSQTVQVAGNPGTVFLTLRAEVSLPGALSLWSAGEVGI